MASRTALTLCAALAALSASPADSVREVRDDAELSVPDGVCGFAFNFTYPAEYWSCAEYMYPNNNPFYSMNKTLSWRSQGVEGAARQTCQENLDVMLAWQAEVAAMPEKISAAGTELRLESGKLRMVNAKHFKQNRVEGAKFQWKVGPGSHDAMLAAQAKKDGLVKEFEASCQEMMDSLV